MLTANIAARLEAGNHRPASSTLPPHASWKAAAEIIAASQGVTLDKVLSGRRTEEVTTARWQIIAMLKARGNSLSVIGRLLNLNHTSVLHGLRRLAEIAP